MIRHPPRGLIFLMAVAQVTEAKVQSLMDYRKVNQYVDAFTANANMCAEQMREWGHSGANMALFDLWKAFF